jgi:diphthine synthase
MTFYLIGLGLNLKSISLEALEKLRKCNKVYIESYTVELPYKHEELEEVLGVRIISLTRTMVEMESFADEAKNKDIALLVYGDPLAATTHISLIMRCKKQEIEYKVLHNSSIFDAVSETGLQMYKFGKTASMPAWIEKYKPDSFVDVIKENMRIKAHTLILIDIGLALGDALKELEEATENKLKLGKIVVCSKLGTANGRIYYDSLVELAGKEVYAPFCFIIPGKLHFMEQEELESL